MSEEEQIKRVMDATGIDRTGAEQAVRESKRLADEVRAAYQAHQQATEHPAWPWFLRRSKGNLGLTSHAEWYAFRDGWDAMAAASRVTKEKSWSEARAERKADKIVMHMWRVWSMSGGEMWCGKKDARGAVMDGDVEHVTCETCLALASDFGGAALHRLKELNAGSGT